MSAMTNSGLKSMKYTWEARAYAFSLFNKENLFRGKISPKIDAKENLSIKSLSKFEKYFWITIAILALIFLTLFFIAHLNNKQMVQEEKVNQSKTVVDQYIDKYFATDRLKTNLESHQKEIEADFKEEIMALSDTIDREIEHVFSSVEYRIDSYLDYHYSVVGEYSEMYAMASNKISNVIEKRLMGSDFSNNLQSASDTVYNQYNNRIKEHLALLSAIAYDGVEIDLDINRETLEQLQTEIVKNQMLQEGKFSLLISAMIAKKISVVIVAKLASKAGAKLAAKGAVKVGSKMATATGAGLAGLVCGPGVVVCAPVLAVAAWFATDAVIVTADEHFNRDSFKMDILEMLEKQKSSIKRELKATYSQSFETVSQSSQAKIAMTSVQEKRRVNIATDREVID